MEETYQREDLHVNVLRQSSGSLKAISPRRSSPTNSPSYHRLRASRKNFKGSWGRLPANRLIFLLVLITIWAYIGFYIQSNWAHSEHSKPQFVGYKSQVGGVKKVKDVSRRVDTLVNEHTNSSQSGSVIIKETNGLSSKILGSSPRRGFSQLNTTPVRKRRSKYRPQNNHPLPVKVVSDTGANAGETRRNTSYGLLIGPFDKIEDSVLGWNAVRRKVTCDKKFEFGQLVLSRRFVLIFHELSMTGAPLSMLELATEILSCGGTVAVVVLNRNGGLMGELIRRRIKVINDKRKLSYKFAKRADFVVAGSAVCSSWIEQYVSRVSAGSSQIIWWIMENRREYFDRSKHLLNQVKMLVFLSDLQSKQWLTWCEEEHIHLKTIPAIVSLSVNDELAFVAGLPSSFNTPSFTIEKMQEKKNILRFAVRKELGLTDSDILVLSLSSINPGKGQLLLLESVLLMTEQKPQLLGLKNLVQDRNLSNANIQSENQQQGPILESLEDALLQTNGNNNYSVKKRRKKHSRLPKLFSMNVSSETIRHLDAGRQRKQRMSDRGGMMEPKLKVLIGSIGSKSNKVLYVERILRFLSQYPDLSKSLLWTRSTTRVSSLYAAADAYVINSQGLGETFGRVTVEAMAFGLPVLGTDAGGTREIVEDKVTGLLHPVGREGIQPLAKNLQFLVSNPAAREQLGKNGRLMVEKMYLKRHMFERMAELFSQCMETK